ncbi:phage tail length tape measure family protein [Pseudoroseicyclus sp. H15]
MTFVVSGRVEVDGAGARAEVRRTSDEVRNLGRATDEQGRSSRSTAGAEEALTARTRARGQASATAAGQARQLDAATQLSAGSVANLGAQFNDIGVMLAAGQNPLQLAVQQGTQITQVIGPMGAGGAVRSLGAAFMTMLSPVNLITIGSIAAGAAMIQWLTSSMGGARSLDDTLEALNDRVDEYVEASERARRSTAEWRVEEGRFAEEAAAQAARLAEDRRRAGVAAARDVIAEITSIYDLRSPTSITSRDSANFRDMFGMGSRIDRGDEERLVSDVYLGLRNLDAARTGSVEDQYAAFMRLIEAYRSAAAYSGQINATEQARISILEEQAAKLREILAEDDAQTRAAEGPDWALASDIARNEARVQAARTMVEAEREAAEAARQAAAERERAQGALWRPQAELKARADAFRNEARARLMREVAQAEAAARVQAQLRAAEGEKIVAQNQLEANVTQAIARYGANSVQAMRARAAAVEATVRAEYEAKNYAAELVDQIVQSTLAAQGLASTDIASTIAAGSNQAAQLARNLGIALSAAQALANAGARLPGRDRNGEVIYDPRDPRYDAGLAARESNFGFEYGTVSPFAASRIDVGSAAAGGGGAASAAEETDAAQELIERLTDERAILRELDPVQKEMLRNREALSEATREQRAQVQELIIGNYALERAQETFSFLRESAADFVSQLRPQQGENFLDGLARSGLNLLKVLEDAVWQAALLGEGPLAGTFGTSNGSGWVDQLLGALLPSILPGAAPGSVGAPLADPGIAAALRRAEGGPIWGQGHGTADKVPVWASAGEFVVNARATRRNLPLLEAINAGAAMGRFAAGGQVGGGPASDGFGGPLVVVEDHTSMGVTREEREEVTPSGQRRTRLILADAVGEGLTTPGGGGRRVLRRFGIDPPGPLR